MKLRSDLAGFITAVRFYKPSGETGPHTVSLWNSAGALLGAGTSSGETAAGWQQVALGSLVPISPNTTYVASYHTNGRLAYDLNAFTTAGIDAAPLHLLKAGVDGPNGVYLYTANGSSGFPTTANQDANYGVDVVFTLAP